MITETLGRAPFRWRRLLLSALAGGVPGVVLAWFLIWRWWLLPSPLAEVDFAARYLFCSAVFLAGALYGAHRAVRGSEAGGRTVAAMAALLPLTGGIAIPVTMAFASAIGYRTSAPALLAEALIVGALLAAGTVAARWWALRPLVGPPRLVSR